MIGIKDRFSHSPCQSADCATQAKTEGVGPADRAQCEALVGRITAPRPEDHHPVHPLAIVRPESELRQMALQGHLRNVSGRRGGQRSRSPRCVPVGRSEDRRTLDVPARCARAGSRESVEAGTPDRHKHIAHRRFVGPVTGGAWPSESEQQIDQRDPRSRAHTASPLLLVGAATGMRPVPVRTCGGGAAHLAHARAESFLPRRGGNSRPAHA